MSIDAEPALAAERDARERAIAPVAAACPARVDVTEADAADPSGLRERTPQGALVACLDVLDRVPAFATLVEVLQELARERGATVVLGVPNDGLGSPAASAWTDGAVDELRSILGPGVVAAGIHELRGAAVVREGAAAPARVEVDGPVLAPVGWLLAFGAHAERLADRALAGPVDTTDQRRHVLSLEADRDALRALRGR